MIDLALVSVAGVIGLRVLIYVVMDGFDFLGIGITVSLFYERNART